MPFCSQCAQEYEGHVVDCPDCEVALVEELAATHGGLDPEFRLMLVLAADEQVGEILEQALQRMGIPARRLDRDRIQSEGSEFGLLLPQEMFRQAMGYFDGDPRLIRTSVVVKVTDEQGDELEEALICYRLFEPEPSSKGEIRAPELLQQSVGELISQGGEIVDDLLEFIRRGDEATRKKALAVMFRIGSDGLEALARMLAVLSREGRETALFAVLQTIHARLTDPAQLSDLIAVAQDLELEPRHRALALHALGRCELRGVYEPILALLDDPDPIIREEADEALCSLADEDMGFDPELPPEDRAAIREKWRVWFLDRTGP